MIALITPTGGRPKQIELCSKFMKHQNYEGKVLWVLVDDVDPPTINHIPLAFKENWTVKKILPLTKWAPGGMSTQSSNLLAGLEEVKKYDVEAIFIIEDDDYYSPGYLKAMMEKMEGYDVAGQTCTVYYNPIFRGWMRNGNTKHASLFQLAFTPKMIPVFRKSCLSPRTFIDMTFFRYLREVPCKINLFDGKDLAIGIKGLPGRKGIGMGHRAEIRMTRDLEFTVLRELIGDDYIYYL